MTPSHLRFLTFLPVLALGAGMVACGGGGSDGPSGPSEVMAIAVVGGNGQTDTVGQTLPLPLLVSVTADGVPAAGRVVKFTPTSGSGGVTPVLDTTGVDGIATTQWALPTLVGTRSVVATLVGNSLPGASFTAIAVPGAPASFTRNGGNSQIQGVDAAFPQALLVRLVDQFNNGISGATVSWSVDGSGVLSAPTSVTAANGSASMNITAGGSGGALVVHATVAELPTVVDFTLTVVPALVTVTVANNFFSPKADTIPVGGAVRWSFTGGNHDVSPTSGPPSFEPSPVLSAGSSFGPFVFNTPGVYTYICTIHDGMNGTITVQ